MMRSEQISNMIFLVTGLWLMLSSTTVAQSDFMEFRRFFDGVIMLSLLEESDVTQELNLSREQRNVLSARMAELKALQFKVFQKRQAGKKTSYIEEFIDALGEGSEHILAQALEPDQFERLQQLTLQRVTFARGPVAGLLSERLIEEIEVSEKQQAKLQKIRARATAEIEELEKQSQARLDREFARLLRKFKKSLDDNQKKKFKESVGRFGELSK